MTPLPSQYTPLTPADFIGPARDTAELMDIAFDQARAHGNAPIKMIILGPPGTGKSALARFAQHRLGCGKWSVNKKNGTQVDLETADAIARDIGCHDLFSPYRMIQIEEIDQCTPKAQVRLLTILDDLPAGNAIICTSNCRLNELESRFQTRWKFYEVKGPNQVEIEGFLKAKWSLEDQDAKMIAFGCGGNVRAALLDAEAALETAALLVKRAKSLTP